MPRMEQRQDPTKASVSRTPPISLSVLAHHHLKTKLYASALWAPKGIFASTP